MIKAAAPNPAYHDCDWVTFRTLPEAVQHHDSMTLPLPFSPIYAGWWKGFLKELNSQYGGNSKYSSAFVSISVAGPVSVSSEMILPTTANHSQFKDKPELRVDTGWEYLIDTIFPPPTQGSQAFIDAWKQTIPNYEIFSGVTLTLTPDDGKNMPELQYGPGNPTNLLGTDCSLDTVDDPLSCDTKAIVLADFAAQGTPPDSPIKKPRWLAASLPRASRRPATLACPR